MLNEPSPEQLATVPRLYQTELIPTDEKVVHLHFHLGSSEWFACEYDGHDLFFGYAILNGDFQNAEWGYFSLKELKSLTLGIFEVICDQEPDWPIRPVKDIPDIGRRY